MRKRRHLGYSCGEPLGRLTPYRSEIMTTPTMIEKVCPVVLRTTAAGTSILVFRRPLAGTQLVKGTREAAETIEAGALRELAEESGIVAARVSMGLGSSATIVSGQLWHFVLVEPGPLPEAWSFDTLDDLGHRFAFFWWRLADEPGSDWDRVFVQALNHVLAALA